MRIACIGAVIACMLVPAFAQEKTTTGGPSDEKAKKTYEKAEQDVKDRKTEWALDNFKKADKQDGGHCYECQKQMIKYGVALGDWKTAEMGAEEMLAGAKGNKETTLAHYQYAVVLLDEGMQKHKDDLFSRAHEECGKALAIYANFPEAVFLDGRLLAYLGQDEAAKTKFAEYIKMTKEDDANRQRAQRYMVRPELARARMAPAFTITTEDGQKISMDGLQGKVVLLDFWATWCEPCREALPHIREVAKKFQGQPLVILSVSLDSDEAKWKEFVTKNEMTWPQYRDGGFAGSVAKMFGVTAIPHTFTIDADGVLQDEHIGDASIEGKLKKLLAHTREAQTAETSLK
ncbi:MAG TPA: TlpA disulfide reductase family protein [Candidatus Acidoferrum sp.]